MVSQSSSYRHMIRWRIWHKRCKLLVVGTRINQRLRNTRNNRAYRSLRKLWRQPCFFVFVKIELELKPLRHTISCLQLKWICWNDDRKVSATTKGKFDKFAQQNRFWRYRWQRSESVLTFPHFSTVKTRTFAVKLLRKKKARTERKISDEFLSARFWRRTTRNKGKTKWNQCQRAHRTISCIENHVHFRASLPDDVNQKQLVNRELTNISSMWSSS